MATRRNVFCATRRFPRAAVCVLMAAAALALSACKRNAQGDPVPSRSPSISNSAVPSVQPSAEVKKPALPSNLQGDTQDPTIQVFVVETGKVESMKVEEYLCGVLAGEMRDDWPDEALKAQAIIARSFLLHFLDEKGGSALADADISTDIQESQAYDVAGITDKIRKMVKDTKGMTMAYEGDYVIGWFYSCSGGITAMAAEGLNYNKPEPPYIQMVTSDDSAAPDEFRIWDARFTKAKLQEAFQTMGLKITDFSTVSISKRGPSGRCTELMFGDTPVNCVDLRTALDAKVFRSTLLEDISWDASKGILSVNGKGFGHGVGMSQWGAFTMATEGKKAEEILKYYFKNVELVKMW